MPLVFFLGGCNLLMVSFSLTVTNSVTIPYIHILIIICISIPRYVSSYYDQPLLYIAIGANMPCTTG